MTLEDRRLAVARRGEAGFEGRRELGGVLDAPPEAVEGADQLGIVEVGDHAAVEQIVLRRHAVGIEGAVLPRHRRIAGVVDHHDQDRQSLVRRKGEALGDRVVHEGPVPDDRHHRPLLRGELEAERHAKPLAEPAGDPVIAPRALVGAVAHQALAVGDGLVGVDRVFRHRLAERVEQRDGVDGLLPAGVPDDLAVRRRQTPCAPSPSAPRVPRPRRSSGRMRRPPRRAGGASPRSRLRGTGRPGCSGRPSRCGTASRRRRRYAPAWAAGWAGSTARGPRASAPGRPRRASPAAPPPGTGRGRPGNCCNRTTAHRPPGSPASRRARPARHRHPDRAPSTPRRWPAAPLLPEARRRPRCRRPAAAFSGPAERRGSGRAASSRRAGSRSGRS